MADKTAFDYVNEIWSIANYVRDVIRPADYNKLILPFAVLRRFDFGGNFRIHPGVGEQTLEEAVFR